ncbi:bifunctional DnaQ family exonuclease/ATP-dependent helicase [Streptococcus sciuri]|uniref:3'-5' exonuclease DinG n=1 Tax=Streptococcus sciuri TaxID=2973939 RepID=A0ABT2F5Y1_9STRE|nr:bifunctional DnaQ family exonuclease/ATP-dependent helicase [Streptococcus sciuri]MCS4487822.1 bifunctional DnaQ family exonuclease/ATP-dependent helicase [Streptococcus sciuri]
MYENAKRKYAVVDLEATSAGSNAAIIQVGIVIIENNQISKTYSTDVNPHETLEKNIIQLTGITDAQLAKAPDFSQVAREIFDLIEDCVFVAHNVKFDANLLAEQLFLEGYELRTPRVDTVELSQVFYPSFEKYGLSYLADALDLDLSQAHTAVSDAYATAQLFLQVKEKIENLPKELLESILPFADALLFESRMLIDDAYQLARPLMNPDYDLRHGLVLRREKRVKISKQMSQQFEINRHLLGLEDRQQQEQFVHEILAAFEENRPTFIEAQSGIGKTYGYLLSLLAKKEVDQLIVAVPTKVLQDQIMAQEATAIKRVFGIEACSLKGPANYIKLDAFYHSLKNPSDNNLVNRFKMQLLIWLMETQTGDLDEIKQKNRFESYFDTLKHDGYLASNSLFKDVDFWERCYERSKFCKLLVTNHAYFLERIQDDKAFAKGKHIIFDEAQRLVLTLDTFSRQQLEIKKLLIDLQKALNETDSLLDKRLLEEIIFELNNLAENVYKEHYDRGIKQLEQDDLVLLKQALSELSLACVKPLQDTLLSHYSDFWISTVYDSESDMRHIFFNAGSKELLNFKNMLPDMQKLYFISATLKISHNVNLANLLGFDTASFITLPRQKDKHQRLLIDSSMPLLSDISEQQYALEIAKRIDLLFHYHYPILVLFTSKQMMLWVSEYLDSWSIKHLTQIKNGTPYQLKKRFDRGDSTILLGTGAFWEGVDFVQADRMIEMIARLPFDNPKDPLSKKIELQLKAQGKQPFWDYFLPLSVLKLKQAIGRTQRRYQQKSVVLILDSRMLHRPYGSFVYEVLKEDFYISSQNFAKSLVEISEFLL